jgi:hypothetical protein
MLRNIESNSMMVGFSHTLLHPLQSIASKQSKTTSGGMQLREGANLDGSLHLDLSHTSKQPLQSETNQKEHFTKNK